MKRRFTLGTVLALMLLVAMVASIVSYQYARELLNSRLSERSIGDQKLGKLLKIQELIETYYVGDWNEKELIDSAARGLIDGMGDRWSHYLSVEEYEAYLNNSSNKSVGVGITVSPGRAEDSLLINEVYADSPAEELGLVTNDEIIAIDGELVAELGYYIAVGKARGEENSRVNLTIRRYTDGRIIDVQAIRRTVAVEAVRSEIMEDNIGYVRVRNFNTRVDDDFATAVDRLLAANVSGIVFDMRNNPGGELNVLLPILDKLLPEGIIITLRDKTAKETVYRSDPDEVSLPMAVLINSESYSAAEFFAAALKEYDKAKLVGQNTSGKGYSQAPTVLEDGSALLLSTNEYFTPSGKSLAGVGLTPDVTVEEKDASAFFSHNSEKDNQLQKAIETLKASLPEEKTEEPEEIPA